jgi:anthranilate phosphoribosyltransferase
MTVPEAIQLLVDGRDLSEQQAAEVAAEIMAGNATPAQISGLLVALRIKGESVDEIVGFIRTMRRGATPAPARADNLVDTCGTGGDKSGTFNISTVSAFVAAGAGCHVAKHGNRAQSSNCGSADVLQALGVDVEMPPEESARCIDEIGVGFLFAPQYHPGARHAAGPRREIGVRTIFNVLGPLLNPAGARRQLIGVYDAELTEPIAQVLCRLGSVHCLVVHGEDGLDEIALAGKTRVTELKDGSIRSSFITPSEFGIAPATADTLRGGTVTDNARIVREVLGGRTGPTRDVVLLNAGATIYVGGQADSISLGVARAAESIDSGRARAKLDALVARSPK